MLRGLETHCSDRASQLSRSVEDSELLQVLSKVMVRQGLPRGEQPRVMYRIPRGQPLPVVHQQQLANKILLRGKKRDETRRNEPKPNKAKQNRTKRRNSRVGQQWYRTIPSAQWNTVHYKDK